jgi:4-diphosphocytidyl-2-C-methyl-D-erythritol kinase
VGADISFFVYDYSFANVSGFGDIVEPFKDDNFDIELFTPNIHCNTSLVYKIFKERLLDKIDIESFKGWERLSTLEVLSKVDAIEANDLYKASLIAYPQLKDIAPKGWYFSGSGSTFFRLIPL